MNILHLHAGYLYGGVETFLTMLAREPELCPEMHHRYVMCFEQRFSKDLREIGAPLTMFGETQFRRPLSVWKARRDLSVLIKKERPDVGICHMSKPLWLFGPVLRKHGIPVVYYMHGPMHHNLDLFDKLARRNKAPDLLIGVSKHTMQMGKDLMFPSVETATINYPMPWPFSRYEIGAAERATLRAEFETQGDDVVIIQAARMNEWKGQKNLIMALGLLKDVPGWVHWMVGGAQTPGEIEYANSLRTLAKELGVEDRIRFIGQRNDVARLMPASDFYCQANNESEGYSLSFTEAFSAGLPIVTTNIGSADEIVDSQTGILTPLHDAPALAAALRSLIEDPAKRTAMGAASKVRIKRLSDPAQQVQRLHRELSRVATS